MNAVGVRVGVWPEYLRRTLCTDRVASLSKRRNQTPTVSQSVCTKIARPELDTSSLCSVLQPSSIHTADVLSPFISVLRHSA